MIRVVSGGMLGAFCIGFGLAAQVYHAPASGSTFVTICGLAILSLFLVASGLFELFGGDE